METGGVGAFRGLVRRAVVDHDNGDVPSSGLDHRADARALLVRRDERDDLGETTVPAHPRSIATRSPSILMTPS